MSAVSQWKRRRPSRAVARLRVMVVDDERAVLKLLESMLHEMGVAQVCTAKSGAEALELFRSASTGINLVICDWNMPAMTGIELLQQIRVIDPNIAFVMVTGRATAESVMAAKTHQVTAYIKKPFSQEEVLKKLEVIADNLLGERDDADAGDEGPGKP